MMIECPAKRLPERTFEIDPSLTQSLLDDAEKSVEDSLPDCSPSPWNSFTAAAARRNVSPTPFMQDLAGSPARSTPRSGASSLPPMQIDVFPRTTRRVSSFCVADLSLGLRELIQKREQRAGAWLAPPKSRKRRAHS